MLLAINRSQKKATMSTLKLRPMIFSIVIVILTMIPLLWWNIQQDGVGGHQNNVDRVRIQLPSSLSTTEISQMQLRSGNVNYQRALEEDVVRDFVPLSCNAKIDAVICQTWSAKFGNSRISYSQRVIIPCGECVIMDYQYMNRANNTSINNKITFLDGIDIIGKLVIPENYQVHIETTHIIVQGICEMKSTLTPITGQPKIHITMITSMINTTTFTPVYENARACTTTTCKIGSKGIVVAGGALNIRGIPSDTPTWVHLYDIATFASKNDTVYLPKSIYGKWTSGAEVVITPHTSVWNATQVLSIKFITPFFSPNSDYVTVQFNESIVRPTTVMESPDFAVEVALLSRNIRLDSGRDDTSEEADQGGHLMISFTPNVVQTIEGVEISNFGQQGMIGRYPIHFHYCNDVVGSIVSKNTIRESNQRCVVVHGTNQVKIINNVAFDTKGHCYMTEDGSETGNEFLYNIGTKIAKANKLIPDEGPNGNETDHEPAIYWITNPTNIFIGNVAAGSEHSGFWFEPKLRGIRKHLYPNYNPMFEPLTLFKDNVAHSCNAGRLGAIRTYTPGYRPSELAIFDGLKVYRNYGVGIFIHRCHNILIENSIVADNHIGIDIDRAEGIEVRNTTIIGESESYRVVRNRQDVPSICSRFGFLTGLDLHTWKVNLELAGVNVVDVTFKDFNRVNTCKTVSSISFDKNTLKDGLFEFYAFFRGTNFQSTFLGIPMTTTQNRINLCLVQSSEFDMIYVSDDDGSLSPATMLSEGPATLLASDSDQLLRFVNTTSCTYISTGCYHYCRSTCFRSVRYSYEGIDQETWSLKVCKSNEPTVCINFPGGRRGENGGHTYIAHLPVGNTYVATLLNGAGIEVIDGTLKESFEPSASCSAGAVFSVIYEGSIVVENIASSAVLEESQDTYGNDDAM